MFYREAGQFKSSYAADQQIFPIRQDRNLYGRIKQRMQGWIRDFF